MSIKEMFEKSSLFDKDKTIEKLRDNNIRLNNNLIKLQAENLAANKRIEELHQRVLKLQSENDRLKGYKD